MPAWCKGSLSKCLCPYKQGLKVATHQLFDLRQIIQHLWSCLLICRNAGGLNKISGLFHQNALKPREEHAFVWAT